MNLRCCTLCLGLVLEIDTPGPALSASAPNTGPQAVCWEDLSEHLMRRSVPLIDMNLCDCPENVLESEPSRGIAQVIENTFYWWHEYALPRADGTTSVCVVMKKPEPSPLTARQARILLTASAMCSLHVHEPEETVTLAPSDAGAGLLPIDPLFFADRASSVLKTVVGSDDRVRVVTTACFPWNTHCFLQIDFPPAPVSIGAGWRATGFLVSPYVLLTCGHVVYDQRTNSWVERILITPGQRQVIAGGPIVRPYGIREGVEYHTNADYLEGNRELDYGAVFFNKPFAGIDTYLPLEFSFDPMTPDDLICLAGYPAEVHLDTIRAESDSRALWEAYGFVYCAAPHTLYHTIDSSDGDSGGPVRRTTGPMETGRVVAIHHGSTVFFNAAVRLAPHNEELIAEWMQWVPQNEPGTVVEYASLDVPKMIRDLQTTLSTLIIEEPGLICDLDVMLDISHAWCEDLAVFLIGPDETRVELFTDVGGDGRNFRDTILDDEAAVSITVGSAPFQGSYQPEGQLSDFDGKEIAGVWTLEVTDDERKIGGMLNAWSLIAEMAAEVHDSPNTQADGAEPNGGLNTGCDKDMTSDTFWSGQIDDVRIHNRAVQP